MKIRRIVGTAAIVLAIVFWFGPLISGETSTSDYEDALDSALAEDVLNNTRTEGAPQQQVVNGWTARDLLAIEVQQNNDLLAAEYRQNALLFLLIAAVGWLIVSNRPAIGADETQPDDSTVSMGSEPTGD